MDISGSLKAGSEGIWVEWKDGAAVKLSFSPEAVKSAIKQCSSKVLREGKTIDEVNSEKLDEILNASMIMDWRGLKNGSDDFPCTPENKKLLMSRSPAFNKFVSESCLNLENIKESEIKN